MTNAKEGLQVTRLTKTYPGGIRALDAVDLTVGPGLYGLLGPNGAGKSTLMRTLATLQKPDSGSITLDGVDALADPDYVRRRLGYLPQHIGTYPTVTGRQLLERFAWLKGRTDKAERRREVAQLLERVNLRARRPPSGGTAPLESAAALWSRVVPRAEPMPTTTRSHASSPRARRRRRPARASWSRRRSRPARRGRPTRRAWRTSTTRRSRARESGARRRWHDGPALPGDAEPRARDILRPSEEAVA